MAEDKVNVNVKGPSDVKMTVSLPKSATVREFKELIAAQNEQFPADEQRLIYSGRVLKDDEVAVDKYNIKEGHTVQLVSPFRRMWQTWSLTNTRKGQGSKATAVFEPWCIWFSSYWCTRQLCSRAAVRRQPARSPAQRPKRRRLGRFQPVRFDGHQSERSKLHQQHDV